MQNIIWPETIDPKKYPIHAYNQIATAKNPEEIWKKLVLAEEWPKWYSNSRDVKIIANAGPDQTLILGTKFSWQTFGIKVLSEVIECKPYESLGWTATELLGWQGYHGWRIAQNSGNSRIVTEEVQKGFGDFFVKKYVKNNLEKEHQNWLTSLVR